MNRAELESAAMSDLLIAQGTEAAKKPDMIDLGNFFSVAENDCGLVE
jgi:hypothetical protein